MSEQTPCYGNPDRKPESLQAFANLPCALSYIEPGYMPPEPEQIKALLDLSGLNRRQWAEVLGVTYSDKHGSTTIRKWCMDKSAKDYREIPYSTWRFMLAVVGIIDPRMDAEKVR